jgi:DNA polymerase-3 subunit alpha
MGYYGSIHNHTEYSNLRIRDSINRIDDMLNYAEELGHKVIGFTDHETTSSWIKIEKAAEKHPDLKVLRGNEIYLVRNGLNNDNFNKDNDKYYHFVLIAKDLVGAKQIFEISTRAWYRSYMARGMRRVPTYYQDLWDIIGSNPGHVIGSTACLGGALPTQILRGTSDETLGRWISQMCEIFGSQDFYLEMQPSFNKEQIQVNKKLLEFANQFNLNYIITTDSHYLKKDDRPIHKAYLNAQNGDREVDDFYATTYMMGTEELESYFNYFSPEILQKAYASIEEIAKKCENFSLLKPLKIPELKWKPLNNNPNHYYALKAKIPALEKFLNSPYKSDQYLVDAIIEGIESHPDLQNDEAYNEINSNLEMTWKSSEVNKTQWSAYYLNLQQIIDLCWEAGSIVGPGRGSGVGFILLYVLGITQINPLRETTRCFSWRLTLRV